MILGKNFSNLKVILVEPNGPLNVGSVARLCSNFEVDELRIVSPKCDIFSLDSKKMAIFFESKENISHFGETILNSSTSKLEHNLATLPTFKGPFGSTNITFKLEKFFPKIIQGYEDILINWTYLQDQFQNLA